MSAFAGMDYVWAEDIEALEREEPALLFRLEGALSIHAHGAFVDPFLRTLFSWLWKRVARDEKDLDPHRRSNGRVPCRVRGDDLLEGLCIRVMCRTNKGYMEEATEKYFLTHIRPTWNIICAKEEL